MDPLTEAEEARLSAINSGFETQPKTQKVNIPAAEKPLMVATVHDARSLKVPVKRNAQHTDDIVGATWNRKLTQIETKNVNDRYIKTRSYL